MHIHPVQVYSKSYPHVQWEAKQRTNFHIKVFTTFPAGDARCLNRSASVGSEAWAAKASRADWITYELSLLVIQNNELISHTYGTLTKNKPFWVNLKDQHIESMLFLWYRVGKEVARSLSFHQMVYHPLYQCGQRNKYLVTNPICSMPRLQLRLDSHSKHQHDPQFHIWERTQVWLHEENINALSMHKHFFLFFVNLQVTAIFSKQEIDDKSTGTL